MPITHATAQRLVDEARDQFRGGPKSSRKVYPLGHSKHALRTAGGLATRAVLPALHQAASKLAVEEYARQLRHARISYGEATEMTLTTAALLREQLPRGAVSSAWLVTVDTAQMGRTSIGNAFLGLCDETNDDYAAFAACHRKPTTPPDFLRQLGAARGVWLLDPFFNVATTPSHYEACLQTRATHWGEEGKAIRHELAGPGNASTTKLPASFVKTLFDAGATLQSHRLDLDRLWAPFAPDARTGVCIAVMMPDAWARTYPGQPFVQPNAAERDALRRGLCSMQALGLPTVLIGTVPEGVRPAGWNISRDAMPALRDGHALLMGLLRPPTEWLIVVPWNLVYLESVIARLLGAADDCAEVLAPMRMDGQWHPFFARYRVSRAREKLVPSPPYRLSKPAPLVLSLDERDALFAERPYPLSSAI